MKKVLFILNVGNEIGLRKHLIDRLKKRYNILTVAPMPTHSEINPDIVWDMKHDNMNLFHELKAIYSLCKITKKEVPDIIVTFSIKPNLYGAIASRILGIPQISLINGIGRVFTEHKTWYSGITKFLWKKISLKSFKAFQTENDRDLFIKENFAILENTIVIPSSGVDTVHYSPATIKKVNSDFEVLFVGRTTFHKGIEEFVQASKLCPKIRFSILGKATTDSKLGYTEQELRMLEKNIPNLKYSGYSLNPLENYQRTSVVILPSYREGIPRAIIEACACGKPVIVTDLPGCAWVTPNIGIKVKIRSVDELAFAISKLYMMKKTHLNKMGQTGRKYVTEHFSIKIVEKMFIHMIEKNIKS